MKIIKIVFFTIIVSFLISGCATKENQNNKTVTNASAANENSQSSAANSALPDIPQITPQQYDNIKLGLSKDEVEKFLGKGKSIGETTKNGVKGDTYQWSFYGSKSVTLIFQDSKVKSISEEF